MNELIKNLQYYISQYDVEKDLFERGKTIKQKGYLTKEEFMWICLWKSRRPKPLLLKNTVKQIMDISQKAFSEPDEKKKMEYLCQLDGVQIPTASAILCVVYPEKYPVIDIRCVQSLNELGLINWTSITIDSWVVYINVMREIANQNEITPRELDKALFAYNRIKLDDEYKNLYKK